MTANPLRIQQTCSATRQTHHPAATHGWRRGVAFAQVGEALKPLVRRLSVLFRARGERTLGPHRVGRSGRRDCNHPPATVPVSKPDTAASKLLSAVVRRFGVAVRVERCRYCGTTDAVVTNRRRLLLSLGRRRDWCSAECELAGHRSMRRIAAVLARLDAQRVAAERHGQDVDKLDRTIADWQAKFDELAGWSTC